MHNLHDLSVSLASAVETVDPGLVRVDGRSRMGASGIVWSSDSLVVTANHVVSRDDNISVGFADGSSAAVALVGRDPTTDLALLRVDAAGLTPPIWLDGQDLRVGHLVLALGRPGQRAQATLGVISALDGEWRTGGGALVERYVQTDVRMYPGFSGGPLVDTAGRVAGLNSSGLARGVSISLPTATVQRVVQALLTHGRVRKGYLGIGIQPVRLPAGLGEELGQETGLLITSVEAGSPAEGSGLLLGDALVAVDGQPVGRPEDLNALLSGDRVGSAVPTRIVRGGQLQSLEVRVGERGA